MVTLRSSLDPLLAAHTLTNGSLHFGRSSIEEVHHANAVGLIGAIMCVPPLVALVYAAVRAALGAMRGR